MVGHDHDAPPACGQEAPDPLGDEVKLLLQHLRQGMPVVMAECVNSVGLSPADPAGVTRLGPGSRPLARVVDGVGNGAPGPGPASEGAWADRVVGTYLHGPVLARNPALADLLLGWALGRDEPLAPLDDRHESALRAERLGAPSARRRPQR